MTKALCEGLSEGQSVFKKENIGLFQIETLS